VTPSCLTSTSCSTYLFSAHLRDPLRGVALNSYRTRNFFLPYRRWRTLGDMPSRATPVTRTFHCRMPYTYTTSTLYAFCCTLTSLYTSAAKFFCAMTFRKARLRAPFSTCCVPASLGSGFLWHATTHRLYTFRVVFVSVTGIVTIRLGVIAAIFAATWTTPHLFAGCIVDICSSFLPPGWNMSLF